MTLVYAFLAAAAIALAPFAALRAWNEGARLRRRWAARGLPLLAVLAACNAGGLLDVDDAGCPIPDAGAEEATCHCDPLYHMTFTCGADGVSCLVTGCDIGWADCDGNPENGCEADLSTPAHCWDCSLKCEPGGMCTGPVGGPGACYYGP